MTAIETLEAERKRLITAIHAHDGELTRIRDNIYFHQEKIQNNFEVEQSLAEAIRALGETPIPHKITLSALAQTPISSKVKVAQ